MKKFYFAFFTLLLLTGCTIQSTVSLSKRELNDGYVAHNFNNGLISFDILPQLGAVSAEICYIPENIKLMKPLILNVEKDDLLPQSCNPEGGMINDFLWGVTTFGKLPTKITRWENNPEKSLIQVKDRYYRMQNCEYTKTVSLKKNSTAFQVEIELTNHAKKTMDAAPWQNVIQCLSEEPAIDTIIMPIKGGIKLVGRRGVKFVEKDCVFPEKDLSDREVFAVPLRPWIAASNDSRDGLFVLLTTNDLIANGALFYTYKTIRVHTMEFIGSTQKIQPKKSEKFYFDYIYFPGLNNLSEVFKVNDIPVGFYAKASVTPRKLTMTMQSAAPIPSKEWEFILTAVDGKKYTLGKWQFPELEPTEAVTKEIGIRSAIPAGEYKLSAVSGSDKFSLIDTFKIL
ncbi:MAG: hypothetical protein J6W00_03040 [Lentisphaeria bacterium]|nr:hypothetical protein [Lentisphaeria bacterium]